MKRPCRVFGSLRSQSGQTIIAYLVFVLLGAATIAGVLQFTSTHIRVTHATKKRGVRLYDVENDLGKTLSWLRDNSKNMLSAYTADEFYTHFVPSPPSIGANDGLYTAPTQIKAASQNDSIILTNSPELATSYFPPTTNIETGVAFDAVSDFNNQAFESRVRITLINAIPVDAGKDNGPPPAPKPSTPFYPIYRIDVMTETDEGMHLQSYIASEIEAAGGGMGFYGSNTVNFNESYCDSYDSSTGPYSSNTKKAGCEISSHNNIVLTKKTVVYGSAVSTKKVHINNGSTICADFEPNCPNPGSICEGESCSVAGIPPIDPWNTLCPQEQQKQKIEIDTTLFITGPDAVDRCWKEIEVADNVTLTLASTDYPYFFGKLDLGNNSTIEAAPQPADGTITLYLDALTPRKLTGSMLVNSSARPVQFNIFYLDNASISLEGNSAMAFLLTAPKANVKAKGAFDFFGAIAAKNLHAEKGVHLHYDGSNAGGEPSAMRFRLRDQGQTFR